MASTGGRQFNWFNLLMVICMSFGSMSYGYSASIIATTLAQPTFLKYFDLDTRPDATSLISTMNGLYQVGGFFGVFTVSYFADRWGRRAAIGVSALITVLSGALLAGSVNVAMFIVFRFFSGAGAFMILSAVPIWMNEVTPPRNRGLLVDIHGAALLFGYMVAAWVGFAFFHLQAAAAWRAPLAFQCLPAVCLLCFLPFMPESPRFLLMHDRHEEAAANLRRLHTSEEAEIELQQISAQMQIDRTLPSSYWVMLKKPSYRKRTLLCLGVTCGIQFSGILVINNYGPTLYASLGYGTAQQLVLLGGWLTLAFGMGCASLYVVDRFSRPKLMGFGILGCMVCLIIEAALVAQFVGTKNTTALSAAVAMFYVYVIFYEVCLDGPQFAYLGELFPTHIRAKGMNIGVAGICLMNIIWLQAAPTAFQNIGWKFYLCFIIPGTIAGLGIFLYFPDTNGIPLEEVAAMFGDVDELYSGFGDDVKAETEIVEGKTALAIEHNETAV
ncbi:hypothetical protein LTR36_001179 [Oleoguttula mirabilis]|uniref:Major facilitator superfamily (MFS) profile domain-containing protein n=1 Tax=Oleoguttula mirabilis TaxID=1507867 RepID=A0AAV9J2V0_9PEZI|nr:hypothetical protein LTR36_001179 [Oleoguttula mirabilis]